MRGFEERVVGIVAALLADYAPGIDLPDGALVERLRGVMGSGTVYGVWEQNRDGVGDPDTLIALFWDENAAKSRVAEAPVYNAGGKFAEQAIWFVEEHGIT